MCTVQHKIYDESHWLKHSSSFVINYITIGGTHIKTYSQNTINVMCL